MRGSPRRDAGTQGWDAEADPERHGREFPEHPEKTAASRRVLPQDQEKQTEQDRQE
jgi:hypothetical protein